MAENSMAWERSDDGIESAAALPQLVWESNVRSLSTGGLLVTVIPKGRLATRVRRADADHVQFAISVDGALESLEMMPRSPR